jgi:hypothetical protein
MTTTLTSDMFTDGVYSVTYGLKKASFTIVDESYVSNGITAEVKRMVCDIQLFNSSGVKIDEVFGSLVIGLGDDNVAITTEDTSILGLLMDEDNMSSCTVELYE